MEKLSNKVCYARGMTKNFKTTIVVDATETKVPRTVWMRRSHELAAQQLKAENIIDSQQQFYREGLDLVLEKYKNKLNGEKQ